MLLQKYWDIGHASVTPSGYLNIEMSDNQRTLLNPTQKYGFFGFIAYDAKGEGSVHKIAKRRLNVIEGNVNSYSKLLNNPERLKSINNFNQLCESVAEVSEEVEQQKVQRK